MQSQYLILTAIFGWGIGSFFYKISNDNMHPIMVSTMATTVFLVLLPLAHVFVKFDNQVNTKGIVTAIIGGLCMCGGSLGYFFALKKGSAGEVTAVTALYPALTLALSMLFLSEGLTWRKGLGILFALASVVVLSFK